MNDFNGAKSIISGMENSPVYRLKETWAVQKTIIKDDLQTASKNDLQLFEKISEILSPNDNCLNYRRRIKKCRPPVVPFLGVHLGDLIYLNEAKRQMISKGDVQGAIKRESDVRLIVV